MSGWPLDMSCKTCVFWRPLPGEPGVGFCHRWPPTPLSTRGEVLSGWPRCYSEDWCGEWKEPWKPGA